jgi:hypothetical protein
MYKRKLEAMLKKSDQLKSHSLQYSQALIEQG